MNDDSKSHFRNISVHIQAWTIFPTAQWFEETHRKHTLGTWDKVIIDLCAQEKN